MDVLLIILIALLVSGIGMLIAVGKKQFKSKGPARMFFLILGIVFVAYSVVGVGDQFGWYELPDSIDQAFLSAGVGGGPVITSDDGGNNGGSGFNTYQPTATYSTKDKYSTTTVSGTSYYKQGSSPATSTAKTNVNEGTQYTYWVDNGTYWVQPVVQSATQGVNEFVANAYQNGSVSLSLYDQVARTSATNGASNVSMGANDEASIEITYDGTSDISAGPFGGVMVAEYNSTISSASCTGDVLLTNNPYHLTYTTSATTHTYKSWAYSANLDDGSGEINRIDCEFSNGASAVGAGAPYYFKFIPANYYVSQNGDILLDTEKFADGDTTRTGSTVNLPSVTGYWGS